MIGTRVLEQTLQEEKKSKVICHEGGSRSSKTWSISQFLILKAIAGEEITVTIVRDKLTWIKSTLLKDFQEIIKMYSLSVKPEINPNRSEQVYYLNGSEFAFYGLDYSEKLHGRKQDWSWMNEVMEIGQKHFDQLEMRTTKGMILDYNPYDDLHWVFDIQKRPDVGIIKSTMLDNPFLEQSVKNKILSYEPTEENIKNGTADEYMWQVYGLGQKARLQGLVFDRWEIAEVIPEEAKLLGYGLDFGFTNDPTAFVEIHKLDKTLYWKQLIYEVGLTNQDIVNRFKSLEIPKHSLIVPDSSEPKSIEELKRAGYSGIRPSKKGADSIRYGIDLMQGFTHCLVKSPDVEREFGRYKWAEDRAGRRLQVPVDEFNHGIDGGRYLIAHKLGMKRELQFIPRDRLGI